MSDFNFLFHDTTVRRSAIDKAVEIIPGVTCKWLNFYSRSPLDEGDGPAAEVFLNVHVETSNSGDEMLRVFRAYLGSLTENFFLWTDDEPVDCVICEFHAFTTASRAAIDAVLEKIDGFTCTWLDPETRAPLDNGDGRPATEAWLKVQSEAEGGAAETLALLNMHLVPLTPGVFKV